MSSFLFLAWWLVIPTGIGILASRETARRSGILVWLGVLAIAALCLIMNSVLQTFDTCGLTVAEMREDLSRNCTYASNSINETFFAHLFMTAVLAFVSFMSAAFFLSSRRGSAQ